MTVAKNVEPICLDCADARMTCDVLIARPVLRALGHPAMHQDAPEAGHDSSIAQGASQA